MNLVVVVVETNPLFGVGGFDDSDFWRVWNELDELEEGMEIVEAVVVVVKACANLEVLPTMDGVVVELIWMLIGETEACCCCC